VSLTAAQMGYLLEAIDWRHPQHSWRPQSANNPVRLKKARAKSRLL
jgi:hypothetical protein